jgi:hypothetical protein
MFESNWEYVTTMGQCNHLCNITKQMPTMQVNIALFHCHNVNQQIETSAKIKC